MNSLPADEEDEVVTLAEGKVVNNDLAGLHIDQEEDVKESEEPDSNPPKSKASAAAPRKALLPPLKAKCSTAVSPMFVTMICRWSVSNKQHCFMDVLTCSQVCARELGYEVIDFLSHRGWCVTMSKTGVGRIEYRNLEVCLKEALGRSSKVRKKKAEESIDRLDAAVASCYKDIQKDQQSKDDDKVGFITLRKINCFKRQMTETIQLYHLATLIVYHLFSKHMKAANDRTLQDWTTAILRHCSEKKKFFQAIFEMLFYYNMVGGDPPSTKEHILRNGVTVWRWLSRRCTTRFRVWIQYSIFDNCITISLAHSQRLERTWSCPR